MSTINIIMATYNGEAYIEEQITSIMESTFQDFLISIWDDGSKDNTRQLLLKIKERYKDQVELHFNDKNQGVVKNFLKGVQKSKSDYIMFCDQDDYWYPEKIEKSYDRIKYLESKYGKHMPLVIYSDAKVVDSYRNPISESFHKSNHLLTDKTDLGHLLMENKLIGCTMLFNRGVVEYLNVVPEHARMHDWWIALIASCFGKIDYIDQPLMEYRQHKKNVVGNQKFNSYVIKRMKTLSNQKQIIKDTIQQAEEFLNLYEKKMNGVQIETVSAFIQLNGRNPIKKRHLLIQYGFLKSGFVRNVGLFIII